MGFIRLQEEKLAVRFLAWQYEKQNLPLPPAAALQDQAARIVDEAHRIAKKRGKNVLGIIKELVADIQRR